MANTRAVRLEIAKPLNETWGEAGKLLHLLASATPKLLRAGYDARIAIEVVGATTAKQVIAPTVRASSPEGLVYSAVGKAVTDLKAWGVKKKNHFAELELTGGMISQIARTACQAFSRRDQGRVRFESKRVLVRRGSESAPEVLLSKDDHGVVLSLKLRTTRGYYNQFAVRPSKGGHYQLLMELVSRSRSYGDCKLQYDERKKKWYAILSYEPDEVVPRSIDPTNVLVIHRGIRNALYLLPSNGSPPIKISGLKYMAQRRKLQARQRGARQITPEELGGGAKGHGKKRRYEHYDALEQKIRRITKTACQQWAAKIQSTAERIGAGTIVIENYGGIEPDEDPSKRRLLERFPFHRLKEAILHRCQSRGHTVKEVESAYISSTCPRCQYQDTRQHNTRTGVFHCKKCSFDRPADWVASYWMLKRSEFSSSVIEGRLQKEKQLVESIGVGSVE